LTVEIGSKAAIPGKGSVVLRTRATIMGIMAVHMPMWRLSRAHQGQACAWLRPGRSGSARSGLPV